MSTIIRTEHLTKQYDKQLVVDSINLEVKQGQIYGFLGANGAGKTTTIRMILGLIKPTSGNIEVFGEDLSTNRISILSRVGAFVDSPAYYGNLTGYENLGVIQRMLGKGDDRIEYILEMIGLAHAKDKLVKNYSLGMKQRLGLALALLNDPQLLILDEPTNGLDPAGIIEIRELIKNLASEFGYTVFLSSHILSEVELMATHVGMIQKGKLIYQGALQDVFSEVDFQLEVGTRNNEKAISILKDHGYQVEEEKNLLLLKGRIEEADKINTLLVTNNVPVYHLCKSKRTLEDIFLSLTNRGEKSQ